MPNPSIFTAVINGYLPEPQASLLNGILFGSSIRTTGEFYQTVRTVGLLHLVVLSGMNITILASIVGLLTQSFSKKVSILITILTIIFFIIFVGAKAPIVRAGIMGIITYVSIMYGRQVITIYALLLSAIFIGIFWPDWLGTISFQLSYAATLGILLFGKMRYKKVQTIRQKVQQVVWKELKTSLSAQLFTVPIIFGYFREVALIAPVSNVLVAPLVAPLMIFGFMTAFLGKIHFILGLFPSYICYAITTYMVVTIDLLAKIPGALIKIGPK